MNISYACWEAESLPQVAGHSVELVLGSELIYLIVIVGELVPAIGGPEDYQIVLELEIMRLLGVLPEGG